MSASKHTPGPWRVSENQHNILSDHAGDRPVLVGTAFHDANAHLIAAAPELLEALQKIADACDLPRSDLKQLIGEVARNAIAFVKH